MPLRDRDKNRRIRLSKGSNEERGSSFHSGSKGSQGFESGKLTSSQSQGRYRRATGRSRLVKRRTARGKAVKGAQNQLKRFKQGSLLAVALTGFLLMLFTPGEAGYSQEQEEQEITDTSAAGQSETPAFMKREDVPDSVAIIENVAVEDLLTTEAAAEADTAELAKEDIGRAAKNEAVETIRNLWEGFYENLPKILVAIAVLILAWLFIRLLRFILRKLLKKERGSGAAITLIVIAVWLFAIGLAISVVAGDIRALVGSLGLIGLALSWSLQTPIESFTGWLMNSFRGYYKVGDRISVGDVFGDVFKIDFLTTTVWEIGAPFRPGFVQAEQPTGRLVTFPNNEILSGTVVNLTGDFPFVWDELPVAVANESDIQLAMNVLEKTAINLLADYMKEPAEAYYKNLQRAGLYYDVPDKPQVFITISESSTDIVIRYLVGAYERRKWKSKLSLEVITELNKPEYRGKIKPVYPRQQLQFIGSDGMPADTVKVKNEDKNENEPND